MAVSAEDIQKRLEPTHLQEASVADIKKDLEEEAGLVEGKKKPPKKNPRDKEEYVFKVDYTDARGKKWEGEFKNRILTVKQRRLVGPLQSRLLLGVNIESLPVSSVELAAMQAHLEYSLVERPEWAETLDDVNDPNVIYSIYGEVASHEAFFQRPRETEEEGRGKSG